VRVSGILGKKQGLLYVNLLSILFFICIRLCGEISEGVVFGNCLVRAFSIQSRETKLPLIN
jgi:hypothetical protein